MSDSLSSPRHPARARFALNAEQVSAQVIDDEAVIINLSSGVYYSLSGSGALAWSLLERGRSVEETAAALAQHYGIGIDQAAGDVAGLLQQLQDEQILVTRADALPTDEGHDSFPAGDYQAPALERYADMADLLALDPPMPGIENIPWRDPDA